MSDDRNSETSGTTEDRGVEKDPEAQEDASGTAPSGPKFTEAPGDPLAGVKKGASNVMASMEGKTVSMKVYVGTILVFVILVLLARCGG